MADLKLYTHNIVHGFLNLFGNSLFILQTKMHRNNRCTVMEYMSKLLHRFHIKINICSVHDFWRWFRYWTVEPFPVWTLPSTSSICVPSPPVAISRTCCNHAGHLTRRRTRPAIVTRTSCWGCVHKITVLAWLPEIQTTMTNRNMTWSHWKCLKTFTRNSCKYILCNRIVELDLLLAWTGLVSSTSMRT